MALYAPRTWASGVWCRSSTGETCSASWLLVQPGLGQQLDGVAQLAGEADVDLRGARRCRGGRWPSSGTGDAEGDLGQDGQLVGGVGAVHVERRVGLGVAAPLGLGERLGVAAALLAHAGEDEVAGAVEDALERQDLVGRQALGQGGDDRDAAADAGLEGDGPAVAPGGVEDLGAVLRPAAPCWR